MTEPKKDAYFCPCCGSQNTEIAAVEKMEDKEQGTSWKKLEIWCHNCPEPINISVEVSNDYELSAVGLNAMSGLAKELKKKAKT